MTALASLAAIFVVFIVVPVAICMLLDRVTLGRPLTPEQMRAADAAYRLRLLEPKLDEVERRLGCKLPDSLRRLYADRELLLAEAFCFIDPKDSRPWFIAHFAPADIRSLDDETEGALPPRSFPFATAGDGDDYYVTIGEKGEDGPVFSLDSHEDPEGAERVADSLAELLSWPRKPADEVLEEEA